MSKYSYEEKHASVELVVIDHLSMNEASCISGIPRTPIMRWINSYQHFGPEGLLMKHGIYDGMSS